MPEVFSHPFGISWRKALVSIPRAVPNFVLHFTNPQGPQPMVFNLPSRKDHLIPVYVFIPPKHAPGRLVKPGAHLKSALRKENHEDEDPGFPVLVDFHGGGFILGSCQEQTPFCAQMCRELNCVVISVDYRLGPYAKYPAANFDAEDVVNAVIDPERYAYRVLRDSINSSLEKAGRSPIALDSTRIAFSGFSSGGNLALNLVLSTKDDPTLHGDWPSPVPWSHEREIPCLLFYPSLDCRLLPHERPRPEGLDPPSGFVERWKIEKELMPTYLPVARRGDPRASPGLADITPADEADRTEYGLHPKAKMFLVLPQFDSLNEQSLVWIDKVRDQNRGGDLLVEEVQGVVHGWTQFPDAWLEEGHRVLKSQVFERARTFLAVWWGITDKQAQSSSGISALKGNTPTNGAPNTEVLQAPPHSENALRPSYNSGRAGNHLNADVDQIFALSKGRGGNVNVNVDELFAKAKQEQLDQQEQQHKEQEEQQREREREKQEEEKEQQQLRDDRDDDGTATKTNTPGEPSKTLTEQE
ncbi:hypothetical protein PV10_01776 [Exophiala mesophila]|uniref:Alpha/beta hydrolase fold-3 domain-containing protein n=1 Tax=Exophiala mesophila TaxID=212818 RepID=A0A0D2AGN8_EXOME|nr:uncharacterized protein PV10_01776 [Exophiala mesophila]KIV98088.1 hypothetical protein PV10_01776 [Exophiala mesophila]